jgi:hypothetical protein
MIINEGIAWVKRWINGYKQPADQDKKIFRFVSCTPSHPEKPILLNAGFRT